jgi:dihydrodipicolinate synthase/N-acetylneuraminate lyase
MSAGTVPQTLGKPAKQGSLDPLPAGIVASSVTPFSGEGEIDLKLLKPHIDWLIAEGVNGLSPLGSSGEFSALEIDDRKRVLDKAIELNNGRVALWAGTHHYSTRSTIELSKHAAAAGADALLIVPPFYMAPTAEQTMDHYRHIASAVDLPIILYLNIPLTFIDLNTDQLLALYQEGAIASVKMSNPEPDRICQLLQQSDGLRVYCGIDSVAFEGLCHGAHGWISGIPSIVPRAARALYESIAVRGDLRAAREQWRLLSQLMRLEFSAYSNRGQGGPHWFSVMKTTLNLIGPPVGDPQLPLQPMQADRMDELIGILQGLGYQVHGKA